MKRKKPTNKDYENAIMHLNYQVSNLTGYINGISEILNHYIEFGGKSKKFFKSLEKIVEKEAAEKEALNGSKDMGTTKQRD